MIKRCFDGFFIFYISIWCIVKFLRNRITLPEVVNSYFTDIVAVPVIAHLCIFIIQETTGQKKYTYPLLFTLFIAGYTSVAFEVIMPRYSCLYVADWRDIFCYFLGAIFYNYYHKPRVLEKYHLPAT